MRPDDVASELEELHRNAALSIRKPTLPACGNCYNCGENLPANSCFCDADCRDDFEKRQKAKNA